MPLATFTKRSITDVLGVLDTPLKLVAMKIVKSNTNLVKQLFGGQFSLGAYFQGVIFHGSIFSGAFFPGTFFRKPYDSTSLAV